MKTMKRTGAVCLCKTEIPTIIRHLNRQSWITLDFHLGPNWTNNQDWVRRQTCWWIYLESLIWWTSQQITLLTTQSSWSCCKQTNRKVSFRKSIWGRLMMMTNSTWWLTKKLAKYSKCQKNCQGTNLRRHLPILRTNRLLQKCKRISGR